jgi:hypothetical protein
MRTARLDYRPGAGPAPVTFNRPAPRPAAPSIAHLLPDWQRALTDLVAAQGPSRAAVTLGIGRSSLWRYLSGTRQPDAPTQRSIVAAWARARGLTC